MIQGLATGIGFVGAGAIMKATQGQQIHGLTTAASVWMAAGLGTAAGCGRIWLPIYGSFLSVFILSNLCGWKSMSTKRRPERPRTG